MRVEIIYNHRSKMVELYQEGNEQMLSGFEFLNNREIWEWFEPFNQGRMAWEGLLKELAKSLDIDIQGVHIKFTGDETSKKQFEIELKKHGLDYSCQTDSVNIETDDIQKNYVEEAEFHESHYNYDEAIKLYKKAYDLGDEKAGIKYLEYLNIEDAISDYIKLANNNNNSAMIELCKIYASGRGSLAVDVESLDKWANKLETINSEEINKFLGEVYLSVYAKLDNKVLELKYLQKSVDKGNAEAQFQMAGCYLVGKLKKIDIDKAVKYLELAVQQGSGDAMYILAELKNQSVIDGDIETKDYIAAAAAGSIEAINEVGDCYFIGFEIEEDEEKAFKYYKKASDLGLSLATFNLAECYENGYGVAQDYEKAFDYYSLAVEQGSTKAALYLGEYYLFEYDGDDDEDEMQEVGVSYLYQAAKLESPEALYKLGLCFGLGKGVEEDIEEAEYYYLMAALRGSIPATQMLAYLGLYEEESSVENSTAIRLLEIMSEQGDTESMVELGEYYRNEGDQEEAYEYFKVASECGEMYATLWLISYHRHGVVVSTNYYEALQCLADFETVIDDDETYENFARDKFAQKLYNIGDNLLDETFGSNDNLFFGGALAAAALLVPIANIVTIPLAAATYGVLHKEKDSDTVMELKMKLILGCMRLSAHLGHEDAQNALDRIEG